MRPTNVEWKRWGIAAAAGILIVLTLYFLGLWQGRGQAEAERQEWVTRTAGLEQELERTRATLAAAEAQNALLRARALLFESALELERRNFGIANERLDAAADRLGAVQDAAAGVDRAALEQLRQQIAATDLRVAADLAGQRARVLDFAARVAELIPQAAPS